MLGSGSMEEASLHSIPSHGHNYRGVVPLEKIKTKREGHQAFSSDRVSIIFETLS